MIAIDASEMLIALTRGDSASIVFSAVDAEGTAYSPQTGNKLKFAVAENVGDEPLFTITNTYDGDSDAFWTIQIDSSDTESLAFKDYVWDVQIETATSVDTIIGKTDDISPIFRVWGEVAQQGV